METKQGGQATSQKKKVVLVRRPESRPDGAPPATEPALQLPKISQPTTATTKKRTVIVERKTKQGEALKPLTPRSEQLAVPPKAKGPIFEALVSPPPPISPPNPTNRKKKKSDGSIVEWSVIGNPDDYREMAALANAGPKKLEPQSKKGTAETATSAVSVTAKPAIAATQQQKSRKNVTEEMFGDSVPAYEHGQLERQAKALERLKVAQDSWKRVQENLSSRLGKDAASLVMAKAESLASKRQEYEIMSTAAQVASGKAEKPLFDEPFRPSRTSQLVGQRHRLRTDQIERFGKPNSDAAPAPMSAKYFRERREQLKEHLDLVDPFVPDINRLVVRGVSVLNLVDAEEAGGEEVTTSPVLGESAGGYEESIGANPTECPDPSVPQSPVSEATSYYPCSADTHYSMAVNVDASEYRPSFGKRGPVLELSDDHVTLWGTVGELISSSVTVHNAGTASVYFSWRRVAPAPLLPGESDPGGVRRSSSHFYFNDLPGVVLPGEHRLFTFVFKSATPGIFFDEWQLLTVPATGGPGLCIHIKAIALPNKLSSKDDDLEASRIDAELRTRSTKKAVRGIVSEVIEAALHRCVASRPQHSQDREIFEKFVSKNPTIHHSPETVAQFCDLAREAGLQPETGWDMAIQKLEAAIDQQKDPQTRASLSKRLEELMLRTTVPEFERARPTLFAIGRMLLAEAIEDLPALWRNACSSSATQVPEPPGSPATAATSSPKRTFAAYLERLRAKRLEETKALAAEEAKEPSPTEATARDEQPQQGQSEQAGQLDRRRRRGWARVGAAQGTTASAGAIPTEAEPAKQPPKAAPTVQEQPQPQPAAAPAKPLQQQPQPAVKAGRRRRARDIGEEEQEPKPDPEAEAAATAAAETEAAKQAKEAAAKRRAAITAMFRVRIAEMINTFESAIPPKPSTSKARPTTSGAQTRPPTAAQPGPRLGAGQAQEARASSAKGTLVSQQPVAGTKKQRRQKPGAK